MKVHFGWKEKGAASVLVAAVMLCLVGMAALVVDAGSLYVEQRQMVTAADAAALAGAKELAATNSHTAAVAVANEYSVLNGSEQTQASVETVYLQSEQLEAVTVQSVVEESLIFARVFGQTKLNVGAKATAVWLYPTKYNGPLFPLFFQLDNDTLPEDNQILMDIKVGPGNWSLLDVGSGKSDVNKAFAGEAYDYKEFFAGVEWDEGELKAQTETGKGNSHIFAIEERMKKAAEGNASMCELIPIVREIGEINGKSVIRIAGFAAFEILDVMRHNGVGSEFALLPGAPKTYDKNQYPMGTIVGRFVEDTYIKATDIKVGSQNESYNFGVMTIKLIE